MRRTIYLANMAACLTMVLFLSACSDTFFFRKKAQEHSAPAGVAELGSLSVATRPATEDGSSDPADTPMKLLVLMREGRSLYSPQDGFREIRPEAPVSHFPMPDCATQVINAFTGGANCCNASFLLSVCGSREYAAYIPPYDGGLGERESRSADTAIGVYQISDGAFMYYEPSGQSGDNSFFSTRVDSPRLQRYLVFDRGAWRADRPGELRDRYERLVHSMDRESLSPEARAITLAYYRIMAGQPLPAVQTAFRGDWPQERVALLTTVFQDIQEAVTRFSPVVNLSVH